MKRSLIIFALLLFAITASAQSYSSPGIPSGTSSFTPTFRTKAATPDSLAQIWLAIGGNKFYRMLSGMDVIVFKATDFEGLGTTSNKLGLRDTLLKQNLVINPADTLHPVLTLIQKKSQDNLWLKGTGITDGRAAIRFTTEKDTGDYEYGFLAGGDNNLYGLRNVRAATPPNISWVWSVNAHNSDYTNFYRHVGMTGLTDTSTAAKILAIDANGKLFKVPYSGGGSDSTLYKTNGTLTGNRVVNLLRHSLSFATSAVSGSNTGIGIDTNSVGLIATATGGAESGQISVSNSGSTAGVAMQHNYYGTNAGISLPGLVGVGVGVHDGLGYGLFYDASSDYANALADSSLNPLLILPKEANDLLYAPIGGSTTIHTSQGISGDGSVGTPVVLGGTFSGNIDEDVGANSIDWHGDNGTYAVDNLIDNTPGGSLISSQASNSAGSHYAAVNIGITSPTGWYAELATNKSGSGASIQLDGNTGNTTITNTLGSFGAQYGADYSTALRLNPNGIASVKVVKDMADSVKGTISAGASPGNPSGLLTFTASNGSNATYLRNDGLHAIDSTVVRSVANSYSLSGMQTKLNNYALTSALPVGANPTATAGSSVVNGSATTFMRSDAAPKVDSAVFRTVANSYSLSGLQTKFNGYVPTSTTVAGFALSSNVTLAALTATDATLTFSGSYTGATARTVGLNLGNANTWTVAQSVALTALGTTQTEAQRWQNTTAAAVGAVQISPFSVWYGNNWSTGSTASVLFGFRAYTLPIQNSSGYNGEWHLQGLTALNTWADALKVDNGGTLTAVNFVSNGGEVNSGTFRNASSNASINFQTARTFNAAGNIIQFNPGSITNSSGLVIGLNATQTINQTSTASYTYNQVNLTETAVGSNGAKFVDYQVAGTSKYSVKDDGTINSAVLTAYTPLQTDASKNVISSPVGQTTLVSGTKAITITGLTTSSKAFCQLVSQGGTVTTTQVYGAVCTSNTLTITALTTAGATDTTDTSVLNYFVVVQ